MEINYAEESQRLATFVPESSSEFWKPKQGQFVIRAISELESAEDFDGDPKKPQAKLQIMVNDKSYTWTMGKGKSSASTYGQLVNLATGFNNSLKDKTFMVVVVVGKGKDNKEKNTYTIVKL